VRAANSSAQALPPTKAASSRTTPETGTTSQGESVEEAIANLREATSLYLEEFPSSAKGHPLVTVFTVEPAHA
jgi:hypothetical protein